MRKIAIALLVLLMAATIAAADTVYLRDGRMLNMNLIRRGYAQPLTIPPNDELAPRFGAAARQARRRGIGLWAPGACR